MTPQHSRHCCCVYLKTYTRRHRQTEDANNAKINVTKMRERNRVREASEALSPMVPEADSTIYRASHLSGGIES